MGKPYLGIQIKTNLIKITGIINRQQDIIADLIKSAIKEIRTNNTG